jgi:ABC-type amino acid transport substrate-binding protein
MNAWLSPLARAVIVPTFCLLAQGHLFSQAKEARLEFLTESAPPYSYIENGELKGLSVEILQAIFNELHSSQSLEDVSVLPWARAYATVQIPGKMNVLFATTRIQKRENLFKWAGPIAHTTMSLWTTAKNAKSVSATTDIPKFNYAAVRDDTSDHLLLELGVPRPQIAEVPSFDSLPLMVRAARADFFAYNDIGARFHLRQLKMDNGEFSPVFLLSTGTLYLAFNKSVPDSVVAKYQAAIDKIGDKISLIVKKYTGSD